MERGWRVGISRRPENVRTLCGVRESRVKTMMRLRTQKSALPPLHAGPGATAGAARIDSVVGGRENLSVQLTAAPAS